MQKNNGYRCENCGQLNAKYEARIILKGKNLLLCFACLEKLKHSINQQHNKASS